MDELANKAREQEGDIGLVVSDSIVAITEQLDHLHANVAHITERLDALVNQIATLEERVHENVE